jgi:hypothetical protein
VFALAAILLSQQPIAAQINGNPSPEVLYAKCKPSVVTILTFDANRAPLAQDRDSSLPRIEFLLWAHDAFLIKEEFLKDQD